MCLKQEEWEREEDKAIESNRMREGNERAMESQKDALEKERENCTARYCLDVDTALLTPHSPGIFFFLSAYFLPLHLTEPLPP